MRTHGLVGLGRFPKGAGSNAATFKKNINMFSKVYINNIIIIIFFMNLRI